MANLPRENAKIEGKSKHTQLTYSNLTIDRMNLAINPQGNITSFL
jgi:hypothetical protein